MVLLLILAAGAPLGAVDPADATAHEDVHVVPGDEATVTILAHQFVPQVLIVTPGTTVTWVFPAEGEDPAGLSAHTVTSGNPATGDASGDLDSPLLEPGDTYTHTFTEDDAGSVVPYFCKPHRIMGMWGAVVVTPADADADPGADDQVDALVEQAQNLLEEAEGTVGLDDDADGDGGDDGGDGDETDGSGGADGDGNTTSGDGNTTSSEGDDGNATSSEGDGNATASQDDDGNSTSSDDDGNATTGNDDGNATTSSDGGDAEQPPPEGDTYHVDVDEFSYEPQDLQVLTYDTVRWSNVGGQPHTVTSQDGTFDSGNLDPGEDFEHTFQEPGTYGYVCEYHQDLGQHGTVTVEERDDAGGTADATTTEDGDGGDDDAGDDEGGGNEDEVGGSDDNSTSTSDDDHDHGTHDHGAAGDGNGTGDSGTDGEGNGTGSNSTAEDEGGDGTASDDAAGSGETVDLRVEVDEYTFTPENAEATVGDTVLWVNIGGVPHTVTSADGTLDSGHLDAGDEFQHTFTEPGTYGYVCEYHRTLGQHGNLTVRAQDAGGAGAQDPGDDPGSDDTGDDATSDGTSQAQAGDPLDGPRDDDPGSDGNTSGAVVDRETPAAPLILVLAAGFLAALAAAPRRR